MITTTRNTTTLREDAINRARLAVRLAEVCHVDSDCLQLTHRGYEWLDDNGYLITLERDGVLLAARV